MHFTDPLNTLRRSRRPLSLLWGSLLIPGMLLAGCADVRLPSIVFNDGPAPGTAPPAELAGPEAVLTGQRPVRRAAPEEGGFPSLASVPQRPTEFSSPVERQALMDRLRGEREEGQAAADALRATSIDPGPVPPSDGPAIPAEPTVPSGPPKVPQPVTR